MVASNYDASLARVLKHEGGYTNHPSDPGGPTNFGITILLSLFASAVLGGIGNAYGALAGGIVIGLSQEWATLFLNPRWKPAVGFVILILTLLVLPRGIFGRARARP